MARFSLATVAAWLFVSTAHAEPPPIPFIGNEPYILPSRFALVIGVENYSGSGAVQLNHLSGTTADAERMEKILRNTGFEVEVLKKTESSKWVTREAIMQQINDLSIKAEQARKATKKGAVIVIYFAGHGISTTTGSYILPSKFEANSFEDIEINGINIEANILKQFDSASPALKILIVDACRTNPPSSLKHRSGSGSGALYKGTAMKFDKPFGFGLGNNHTSVIFSTFSGTAAEESEELGGGVFTSNFVKSFQSYIDKINQNPTSLSKMGIRDIFGSVRTEMMAADGAKQVPTFDDSYSDNFYPLPTIADFNLEKAAFENLNNRPLGNRNWIDARRGIACDLIDMLKIFSQYSYYSRSVIEQIKGLSFDGRPKCPVESTVDVPSRSPAGNWSIPGKTQTTINKQGGGASIDCFDSRFTYMNCSRLAHKRRKIIMVAQAAVADHQDRLEEWSADTIPSNLTFSDLRKLVGSRIDREANESWPGDDVKLNQTVVTKIQSNIRKSYGPDNAVVGVVSAGEMLEVVGSSPGRTWLYVRRGNGVTGFISGDLVEPAIVKMTKTVRFAPHEYEISDDAKADLNATLGLLGGIAILDAAIEYSGDDGKIGFVRASATRKHLDSIFNRSNEGRRSEFYTPVREDVSKTVQKDSILLTTYVLPLNKVIRASIVNISSPSSTLSVSVTGAEGLRAGPQPTMSIPTPSVQVCLPNGTCNITPPVFDKTQDDSKSKNTARDGDVFRNIGGANKILQNIFKF